MGEVALKLRVIQPSGSPGVSFYIFDTINQHQFEIFVMKHIEMAGKM